MPGTIGYRERGRGPSASETLEQFAKSRGPALRAKIYGFLPVIYRSLPSLYGYLPGLYGSLPSLYRFLPGICGFP
jgi:hypothetical protein